MTLGKIDHVDVSIELPAGDFFLDLHQGDEGLYRTEINHIAFSVDDINKEYEDLRSKGVSLRPAAPTFVPRTAGTKETEPSSNLTFDNGASRPRS